MAVRDTGTGISRDTLIGLAGAAAETADGLYLKARRSIADQVSENGKLSPAAIEREQHAAHGLAWLATYVEALKQMAGYGERLSAEGRMGDLEALIIQAAFGEYLNQIFGGIPMSQQEYVRPADLGLAGEDTAQAMSVPAVQAFLSGGNTAAVRAAIIELMLKQDGAATAGDTGLDDTLDQMRTEIRRFADEKVVPHAQTWHLNNDYVPLELLDELAELGVFALTLPEEHGGLGLGKESMCVVSEELSRGYIAVGSIGTRSEIAAELIIHGGTDEQKAQWLPRIGSGEILPTAVFTEPNTGSDLASLRTRAVRDGTVYKVSGNKTWITHPVRADLMTLLVRTDPSEPGYKGLSMLLAEKPRGTDEDPFPAQGMTGGEIEVLGYRGMKEYEIAFDEFEVKAENLLGGDEGQGFKQLMQTFESARIQTAARAVGVAQNALELGLRYAQDRNQFGKPIVSFPRVADKVVMAAVEIMVARQLTYYAARQKDHGRRCDLEAGMAKLLAARVAWSAADNALQIHGGNGFSLEFPVSRV
ncbi:MAG: acyl-CoA dehydrogenase family protein, partial [Hyphomicrobiales bacterium]